MTIRSIYVGNQDLARLKRLLRDCEAQIDQLDEDQLDEAERKLEQRIRRLLPLESKAQKPTFQRNKRAWIWGLGAFSAAALALFTTQPQSLEDTWRSKGLKKLGSISCEVKLVAEDRTDIYPQHSRFELPSDQSVYAKLICNRTAYLHGMIQLPKTPTQILTFNQKIDSSVHYLGGETSLQDLSAFKGGNLTLWITEEKQDKQPPYAEHELADTSVKLSYLLH
jgi:hypothetical protein